MPELPEVETVMRGLEPIMTGKKITSVVLNRKDLRIPFPTNMKQILTGRRINNFSRRAKYILIHLEKNITLAIHLGMSGSVKIITADDVYKKEKHDHVILTLSDQSKIVYNDPRRFGMMFTVDTDNIDQHSSFKHLGPEPLGNHFSADILFERLQSKKTSIKQALLDQHVVVGVGNIYACEALYDSCISPTRISNSITLEETEKLACSIQKILTRAIEAGGSTLKDYRHADGSLGYFQHQFAVYDQEGNPCPDQDCTCEAVGGIKRIVQSGRSTFYCPKKQKG